jgi:hypothetical protein
VSDTINARLAEQGYAFWERCPILGRLRACSAGKHAYDQIGDATRAARMQRVIDDLLDQYNAAGEVEILAAALSRGGEADD